MKRIISEIIAAIVIAAPLAIIFALWWHGAGRL